MPKSLDPIVYCRPLPAHFSAQTILTLNVALRLVYAVKDRLQCASFLLQLPHRCTDLLQIVMFTNT